MTLFRREGFTERFEVSGFYLLKPFSGVSIKFLKIQIIFVTRDCEIFLEFGQPDAGKLITFFIPPGGNLDTIFSYELRHPVWDLPYEGPRPPSCKNHHKHEGPLRSSQIDVNYPYGKYQGAP